MMNEEDHKVAPAVKLELPVIACAVDAIASRLRDGGRLFYVGAGTSGRLGMVDASECPPTFGVPPELVQGIMAGGLQAFSASLEEIEDDPDAGILALKELSCSAADAVVGIAASGRTPFVLGALRYARERGAVTAGITVNPHAALQPLCDYFIAPVVGPEAVTGSTRLKSGTAQKMVLNMISTGIMLRLGRVDGNLMTDVKPVCAKLVERAIRLVMQLSGADRSAAVAALERADGDVKTAVAQLAKLA